MWTVPLYWPSGLAPAAAAQQSQSKHADPRPGKVGCMSEGDEASGESEETRPASRGEIRGEDTLAVHIATCIYLRARPS